MMLSSPDSQNATVISYPSWFLECSGSVCDRWRIEVTAALLVCPRLPKHVQFAAVVDVAGQNEQVVR